MITSSDTLYYDGNCTQCMREMRLLHRWKNESLELVNIHRITTASSVCLMDKNQLLSILHLQTKDGQWLKGLDANVRAWQHTRLGWLLTPLRWPLISDIADSVYYGWAEKRACRLGYSNQCRIPTSTNGSSLPPIT